MDLVNYAAITRPVGQADGDNFLLGSLILPALNVGRRHD